jgi:hypothetical protein
MRPALLDEVPGPPRQGRQAFGWCLLVGGAITLLAALVLTVVAWVALGDAQRTTRQALTVTDDALTSIGQSLQVAGTVVDQVQSSMGTVASGLQEASTAVGSANTAFAGVQSVASALPSSLQQASNALQSLAGVADGIDRTLSVVSRAPFVPQYQPQLGNLVRQLQAALAPLTSSTQNLAAAVDGVTVDGEGVRDRLSQLATDVSTVQSSLAGASAQLAGYQQTAARAQAVTASARSDLDRDLWLMRAAAVPLGIGLALTQLLPLWFGYAIASERRRMPPVHGSPGTRVEGAI